MNAAKPRPLDALDKLLTPDQQEQRHRELKELEDSNLSFNETMHKLSAISDKWVAVAQRQLS